MKTWLLPLKEYLIYLKLTPRFSLFNFYSEYLICLNIGTPKTINFPFETNGKLMVLGVPILRFFRVVCKKDNIRDI